MASTITHRTFISLSNSYFFPERHPLFIVQVYLEKCWQVFTILWCRDGKKKQNVKCVRYDVNGECRVLLIASRDIAKGERLYYDYNGYEHEYPTEHFVWLPTINCFSTQPPPVRPICSRWKYDDFSNQTCIQSPVKLRNLAFQIFQRRKGTGDEEDEEKGRWKRTWVKSVEQRLPIPPRVGNGYFNRQKIFLLGWKLDSLFWSSLFCASALLHRLKWPA